MILSNVAIRPVIRLYPPPLPFRLPHTAFLRPLMNLFPVKDF